MNKENTLKFARSFASTGLDMLTALSLERLENYKDWQLLESAANQLEQAARELRRLEGALQK